MKEKANLRKWIWKDIQSSWRREQWW